METLEHSREATNIEQCAHLYLCFSMPKVGYLLKTCLVLPSCLLHWTTFDQLIRDSLNRILATSLSNNAWLQAQTTVGKGGLRLRSASNYCSIAFLASLTGSKDLVSQLVPSFTDLPDLVSSCALEHLSRVVEEEETI